MKEKKGTIVAIIVMTIMLAAGIAGYTQTVKGSATPTRILYNTNAGKVFFDHKYHADEKDYNLGIDCSDCHHAYEGEDELPQSCVECHEQGAEESSRSEVLHNQCKGCHESEEKGPIECDGCHLM